MNSKLSLRGVPMYFIGTMEQSLDGKGEIPTGRQKAPSLAMTPAETRLLAGLLLAFLFLYSGCVNPFAPGRDDTPAQSACDPHTIEGVFQCFQAAYTFRDTVVYGPLIDPAFVFVYRNYDIGVDVTWGRDDELRTTYGLFQNAQKLDLIWNNIVSISTDSIRVNVVRSFNLTLVFNPSDIERVDGYANLTLERARTSDPWRIVRWRDESNF